MRVPRLPQWRGDPQDRAGSSAGDCVPRRGSRRVPEGGQGEKLLLRTQNSELSEKLQGGFPSGQTSVTQHSALFKLGVQP
ncbi:MAG: hypothetical protein KME32_05485 [Mojavia pulchra JT2-VF2]|uniref:Uncharacterized protein n=1 Tax=Mojavia pulchra JT2-VF2 TaxID=287848 RepID=A0A951PVJ6_9NOST|nr:hypothetical protein [Mojavia pulchra JT2-VF2]